MAEHEQQSSKQHLRPLALMIAFAIVFVIGNSAQYLQAQTPTPAPPNYQQQSSSSSGSTETPQNISCQVEMEKFLLDEEPRYREWMEQHFNNKSSTTSLLDAAFGRYTDFRTSLYNKYAQYFPQQGFLLSSEGLEPGECFSLIDAALRRARQTLERKALSTSTVKKATALLQKYQQINGQLRLLHQNVITMKKHMDTFADKLPCFVQRSCNKG